MVTNQLRIFRLSQGLTQVQLADRTGGVVSQAAVSQIESGRRPPLDYEVIALTHALKVQAVRLFPEGREDPDRLEAMKTQWELDQVHRI